MTTDSDPDTQAAHAVPPPPSLSPSASPSPSNGSTRALIGGLLAGVAGMIIFLFVNISKDGKIRPGPTKAHAGCTRGQRDCLPEVNYVDTAGVAYNRESLAGKVVLVNFWATWCHRSEEHTSELQSPYVISY